MKGFRCLSEAQGASKVQKVPCDSLVGGLLTLQVLLGWILQFFLNSSWTVQKYCRQCFISTPCLSNQCKVISFSALELLWLWCESCGCKCLIASRHLLLQRVSWAFIKGFTAKRSLDMSSTERNAVCSRDDIRGRLSCCSSSRAMERVVSPCTHLSGLHKISIFMFISNQLLMLIKPIQCPTRPLNVYFNSFSFLMH